jgi:hypothetical protein
MEGAKITQILWELAQQLPSLITILVCIVVVIARWKRHPKISLLALVGLTLLFLHGPVFVLIYTWVPNLFISNAGASETRNFFLVLGLIFNVTRAIAFAPLLAAIFMQRPGRNLRPVHA